VSKNKVLLIYLLVTEMSWYEISKG